MVFGHRLAHKHENLSPEVQNPGGDQASYHLKHEQREGELQNWEALNEIGVIWGHIADVENKIGTYYIEAPKPKTSLPKDDLRTP